MVPLLCQSQIGPIERQCLYGLMMLLPVVNVVWIGSELGPIHTACLRSFLRHGHKLALHCYAVPHDTPAGVEIADARALIPEAEIAHYRDGGYFALISDLLRYEILGAELGLYADCDMFCIRPIEDAEYILGLGNNYGPNNAILKLPEDCPILASLRAIRKSPTYLPPWHKTKKRGWYRKKRKPQPLERLKWGTIGPSALTHYTRHFGMMHRASPIDRFYPVHWECTSMLFDPALTLKDIITPRTDALHLYRNLWKDIEYPEGSPLWEIANGYCQ